MSSAFYVADGDRFVSSELTRGPWDPGAQHAGPPAALIGRELERCPSPVAPEADWRLARVTFEILRPVPIAPLRVAAEVVRPGRSVELLAAELADERGPLIRASAWRLAARDVALPEGAAGAAAGDGAIPGPERATEESFFPTGHAAGYHTAMDYRFVAGRFLDPGPATVWMRMRVPLVEGERPSPLVRVLVAADSGNGVSAALDWTRYLFINVDLGVHLHRLPGGEWVCLDALTIPQRSGIGLADTVLADERGPLGRALQTLLVRERAKSAGDG